MRFYMRFYKSHPVFHSKAYKAVISILVYSNLFIILWKETDYPKTSSVVVVLILAVLFQTANTMALFVMLLVWLLLPLLPLLLLLPIVLLMLVILMFVVLVLLVVVF